MKINWPFRASKPAVSPHGREVSEGCNEADDGWDDEAELPIDIHGPVSDELWREIQRREHLVVATQTLAKLAMSEGYPASAEILRDAANRLSIALIRSKSLHEEHSASFPTNGQMALRDLEALASE